MHDTNGNRPCGPYELRKRVRMDCAFGHLTVGPPHNGPGPGQEHRGDKGGLMSCATMEDEPLQEVRSGAVAQVTMPPEPVVTVRRRMRTMASIP